MSTESLSFTVRPVHTHEDLLKACQVRAIAYGQKVPAYRESMLVPDDIDRCPSTGVYICEDKTSGLPVGTMRVQTTRPGLDSLAIESYVQPPRSFKDLPRAEITRLAAAPGADPFVRLALWKTGYMHCSRHGIRLLMIAVRKPALIRAYIRMGAKDIADPIALPYAGNQTHRVMAIDIREAEVFWRESDHPMLQFMAETKHPDIRGFESMDRIAPVPQQLVRVLQRHRELE